MISVEEAQTLILERTERGAAELRPLAECEGLYLNERLLAPEDAPSFDHSGMDGYALRAADSEDSSRWLPVVGEQPAGLDAGLSVGPGEALRIFTGAPIPSGANAVVMQEDVETRPGEVRILEASEPGEFIRRKGGDLCAGQLLAEAGALVSSSLIGLLASQGIAQLRVVPRPSVAVLSTGDELRPPGTSLQRGEIYNSNAPMLAACVRGAGGDCVLVGHASDDLAETEEALAKAAAQADFLVLSGGVSVGEHDHVRAALVELGFEIDFWRVSMMPGKPFVLAHHPDDGTIAFGLPGNPVSSFVTFHLLAAPAIRHRLGAAEALPLAQTAITSEDLASSSNRRHYLRGRFDAEGRFSTSGLQQSHALSALAKANALLPLEPGEKVAAGTERLVLPL